jgi:hypothetical protein
MHSGRTEFDLGEMLDGAMSSNTINSIAWLTKRF